VRDNGAEALGTAMKVVSERAIMPFIGDVENIKLLKIKEWCEKAVITAKVPKAARCTAAKAPVPKQNEPKPVARPPPKRPGAPAKKTISKASKPAGKKQAAATAPPSNLEKELADEEVDEMVADLISPQILTDMVDGNWKTRLSAAEQVNSNKVDKNNNFLSKNGFLVDFVYSTCYCDF